MITLRKSSSRGLTKTSWLESKHTFSFGSYMDQEHLNFGPLRVINEDIVAPSAGFQPHSHRDMEIISIVLAGELEHKDSMGNGSIIRPSEVQLMSAGSGVTHSEFNPSGSETVHFLQIWIMPNQKSLMPSYQQKSFQDIRNPGQLTLLVSPNGKDGSLSIHQDASVFLLDLAPKQTFSYPLLSNRMLWVQMINGSAQINDNKLDQGDGAGIRSENGINFEAQAGCEIMIFDLPDVH